jgi:hypothetical protein
MVLTSRHCGVSDGARTRDNRDHNPVLYQLSYTHHRGLAEAEPLERVYVERGVSAAGGASAAAAARDVSVSGPGAGTMTVER